MLAACIAAAFAAALIFQPSTASKATWLAPLVLSLLVIAPQAQRFFNKGNWLFIASSLLLLASSWASGRQGGEIYLAMASILSLGLWAGSCLANSRQGLIYFLVSMSFWSLAQASYSLYQLVAFHGSALPANPVSWRPWGTYMTPNLMAGSLILWLPFLWHQAYVQKSKGLRLFFLFASLAGTLSFFLARSTGASVAMLASILVASAYRFRWARWGLLFLALAAGFLLPQAGTYLSSRFLLWVPAWHAFMASPWLGYGPDAWHQAYQGAQLSLGFGVGLDPHQGLLTLLLSSGMLGFLLLLPLWAWTLSTLHRALANDSGDSRRPYLAIGLLAALLHAQTEMAVLQPLWLLSIGLAFGLLHNAPPAAFTAPMPGASSRYKPALILLCMLLIGFRGGLHAWALPSAIIFTTTISAKAWRAMDRWDYAFLALVLTSLLGLWGAAPQNALLGFAWALAAFTAWRTARQQQMAPAWAVHAAIIVAVGVALAFLAALYVKGGIQFDTQVARWFFPNDNLLAGAIWVPAIWLCAYLPGPPSKLRWACILVLISALSATGSRGAILALAVSGGWILLRIAVSKSWRLIKTPIIVLILGLISYALPWAGNGFYARFGPSSAESRDPLVYARKEFWRLSMKAANQKPYLGWGLGSYAMAMEQQARPAVSGGAGLAKQALMLDHAHHDWLEAAVERGWPLTVLCGMAVFVLILARLRLGISDIELGLEACLLAWLAQSGVDTVFHTPAIAMSASMVAAWLWPFSTRKEQGAFRVAAWPFIWSLLALSLTLAHPLNERLQAQSALSTLDPDYRAGLVEQRLQKWRHDGRLLHAKEALESAIEFYQILPQDFRSHVWLQRVGLSLLSQADDATLDNISRLLPNWIPGSSTERQGRERLKTYLLQTLRQTSVSFSEKASLRFENGMAYWALGSSQDAVHELKEAVRLEPNYARAWQWLAKASEARGEWPELQRILRRLIQIEALQAQAIKHQAHWGAYTTELLTGADWPWIHNKAEKYRILNQSR